MGQRRNRKLLLLEGRAPQGLAQPFPRHRVVPHSKGRTAGPHLRRVHVGNSRTRPSSPGRGRRTDCGDQADPCGARRQQARLNFMPDVEIKVLSASPDIRAMLSNMLIETVANGGSVSFMHPLAPEAADAFWRDSLASAERGERIVFGAFDGEPLVGTVTFLLTLP